MICPRCGSSIPDEASFCNECGLQIASPQSDQVASAQVQPVVQGEPAQPQAQAPVQQATYPPAAQPQAPQMPQAQAPVQPPSQAEYRQPYAQPAAQPAVQATMPSVSQMQPQAPSPGATVMPPPSQAGAASQLPQAAYAASSYAPPAAAAQPKKSSKLKYALIAGAAVLALIAVVALWPKGGQPADIGTDGTPQDVEVNEPPTGTDEPPTGTDEPPAVSGVESPSDDQSAPDVDENAFATDTECSYQEVSYIIPAGWEDTSDSIDDGTSYTIWGEGEYATLMVYSIGESSDSFDAETYAQDLADSYAVANTTEVLNAQSTSAGGYPTAYVELLNHYDHGDFYQMEIIFSTPSGKLVQMSGMCNDGNESYKEQLHAIAESVSLS